MKKASKASPFKFCPQMDALFGHSSVYNLLGVCLVIIVARIWLRFSSRSTSFRAVTLIGARLHSTVCIFRRVLLFSFGQRLCKCVRLCDGDDAVVGIVNIRQCSSYLSLFQLPRNTNRGVWAVMSLFPKRKTCLLGPPLLHHVQYSLGSHFQFLNETQ